MPEFLGCDTRGYYYILDVDLYVYQFDGAGKCYGWLCSLPAWDRVMHNVLSH